MGCGNQRRVRNLGLKSYRGLFHNRGLPRESSPRPKLQTTNWKCVFVLGRQAYLQLIDWMRVRSWQFLNAMRKSLYSSLVGRESCKLKVLGSIPSGGS